MLAIEETLENIDKMRNMKRYRKPTAGYFPTEAEVRTYAVAKLPFMLEYLLWLDSCLTDKEREENKVAVKALRKILLSK